MDPSKEKQRIRSDMRIQRLAVSAERAMAAGEAVARLLEQLPEFVAAHRLALYLALPDEVATDAVLALAYELGKEVLVPRVRPGERFLEFAELARGGPLERGALRTLEPPANSPTTSWMEGDLILVPGVAFDRVGGRLGRGAGYYDRALSKMGALGLPIWGLAYAFQLVERVPQEAHDQKVAGVITEEACHRFTV